MPNRLELVRTRTVFSVGKGGKLCFFVIKVSAPLLPDLFYDSTSREVLVRAVLGMESSADRAYRSYSRAPETLRAVSTFPEGGSIAGTGGATSSGGASGAGEVEGHSSKGGSASGRGNSVGSGDAWRGVGNSSRGDGAGEERDSSSRGGGAWAGGGSWDGGPGSAFSKVANVAKKEEVGFGFSGREVSKHGGGGGGEVKSKCRLFQYGVAWGSRPDRACCHMLMLLLVAAAVTKTRFRQFWRGTV